jgi:hypothetical protein
VDIRVDKTLKDQKKRIGTKGATGVPAQWADPGEDKPSRALASRETRRILLCST